MILILTCLKSTLVISYPVKPKWYTYPHAIHHNFGRLVHKQTKCLPLIAHGFSDIHHNSATSHLHAGEDPAGGKHLILQLDTALGAVCARYHVQTGTYQHQEASQGTDGAY